ncbi:hypothetical protein C0J52_14914 [Blattella germanica]|nr:hypothetical protein C0J52_14914 [Blattella germanica]
MSSGSSIGVLSDAHIRQMRTGMNSLLRIHCSLFSLLQVDEAVVAAAGEVLELTYPSPEQGGCTVAASRTPPDLQAFRRRRPAEERQRTPSPSSSSNNKKASSGPLSPRDRFKDAKEKFLLLERERLEEQERLLRSRRNQQAPEPPIAPAVQPTANSRGNPYPRRGSWSRSRDSEDELEDRPQRGGYFGVHSPPGRDDFGTPEPEIPPEEDDDIFEHGYGVSPIRRVTRRDSYHQEDVVPVRRGHRPVKPDIQIYRGGRNRANEDPRIIPHQRYRSPSREEIRPSHRYPSPNRGGRGPQDEDIVSDRRQAANRYRSPTRTPRRDQDYSPDRRERFLSPTRNPRPQPRNQRKLEEDIGYPVEEIPRYRGGHRDRTPNPTRGHMVLSQQPSFSEDSNSDIPLERYRSPIRNPQPAPRHRIQEEDIIESPEPQRRNMEGRLPRANPFQMPGSGVDKKRRSMFEVLEEERRRNSNELAKEFKRRSYQDGGGSEMSSSDRGVNHSNGVTNGRHAGYQELSEHERFPGLDRDTARIQHHSMNPQSGGHMNLKKSGPPPPDVVAAAASRYRHSYAEPHHMIPHPPTNHHHEMLHRTNSSVSSGRVGIAAVHPY